MIKRAIGPMILSVTLLLFLAHGVSAESHFKDVGNKTTGHDEIYELVDEGIISGYPDGTFKPNKSINRSNTAVLFSSALDLQNETYENVFDDISKNHTYVDEIMTTYHAGIFKGTPNGKFADGPITREQMATVLVNAFDLKDTGKDPGVNLSNVDPSHKESVKILAQHKMTNQLSDYRPNEAVTRAQFSIFLHKAMNRDNETDGSSDNNDDNSAIPGDKNTPGAPSGATIEKTYDGEKSAKFNYYKNLNGNAEVESVTSTPQGILIHGTDNDGESFGAEYNKGSLSYYFRKPNMTSAAKSDLIEIAKLFQSYR